jgi:hypothetical protein
MMRSSLCLYKEIRQPQLGRHIVERNHLILHTSTLIAIDGVVMNSARELVGV